MPPLPLDERIVVIQRPKSLAPYEASPQAVPHHSARTPAPSNGHVAHPPHVRPSQAHFCSPSCKPLTLGWKRGSARTPKFPGERPVIPAGGGHAPSHCHSNGTVTLGPRLPSHTHAVDIRVTVDQGGRRGGLSNSLGRGGSPKGGVATRASSQSDRGQCERRTGAAGRPGGAEHEARQSRRGQPSSSPGGVLQFVAAQTQPRASRREREKENTSFLNRVNQEFLPSGHRKNSNPGTVRQSHSSHGPPVPVPRAAVLNAGCSSSPPSQATRAPVSRRPGVLRGLPLSPSSPHAGGFPSPDHACTVDCARPLSSSCCCCWRLAICRGCRGRPEGSAAASACRARDGGPPKRGGKDMGLRNLGGCLSAASTSNTSSSNSTVSDCRATLFKPPRCASCSGDAGNFESPAILRKKLVGGCLPCAPLSSSAPLRAIQSCVTGCNPKASQTGSSTCSYCSSDPIVVTFNPRRGKPPARAVGASHQGAAAANDDDYSVRTIWPDELAEKMTHAKGQKNHYAGGTTGGGVRKGYASQAQHGRSRAGLVLLDSQNLQEYTRSHLTDHAGRRRLQQGRAAALDFMSRRSGGGHDGGQSSLRRLLNEAEDAGADEDGPRPPSPPSPVSFSPPPSAPGTLVKPRPWQREREGGRALPSARSLHLALDSLNREQDEENSRTGLSLPLSSSLPACLSDEGAATPDAESAAVSPILPFLYLGNERDAQDLGLLLRLDVGYVVNVTTHLPLYHVDAGLRYKRLPATDNSKQNLRQYFEEVFEFIEEAYQSGQGVLVHCQAGVSRSATIAIAYLMKHTLMTMTDAYKYVRSRRPVVSPNLNFMGQLLEFERDLNSGVTPRILRPKLSGVETQV